MYDLASQKQNVTGFTVGEPDFATPTPIIDEANRYMSMGYTKYTQDIGVRDLRRAIAERYSGELRPIDPDKEIIITCGATEALFVTMATIMNPGDEILICEPYFPCYVSQAQLCHAVPVFVPTYEENGFMPQVEDIEKCITDRTKMLLLNSPNNPTGAEINKDTLKQIADIAIQHDLVVLSDEVYKTIRYSDCPYTSIVSLPGMAERTVVVDAFSKKFAMTGWRLGFAIGPEEIIRCMPFIHDFLVSCINGPIQYAGAYAFRHCADEEHTLCEIFKKRRDFVYSGANAIQGLSMIEPQGAFYAFINIKNYNMSSDDFAIALLNKYNVALVPGNGFGECGEGYVRMTYAADEAILQKGLEGLANFTRDLRFGR